MSYSLNWLENFLGKIGECLGIANTILEIAGDLGGIAYLSYRLIIIGDLYCKFKMAQVEEYSEFLKKEDYHYYLICEHQTLKNVSIKECYQYDNTHELTDALDFVNLFSQTDLYIIGGVWIFLQLSLFVAKRICGDVKKHRDLSRLIGKSVVYGIKFLLTFFFSSIIIHITTINYKDKCAQHYKNDLKILNLVILFYTQFAFLGIGIVVYLVSQIKRYFNPAYSVFIVPMYVLKMIAWIIRRYWKFARRLFIGDKDEKDCCSKFFACILRCAKYFCIYVFSILIIVLYSSVMFFYIGITFENQHYAMSIFVGINLVIDLLEIFKLERQIKNFDKWLEEELKKDEKKKLEELKLQEDKNLEEMRKNQYAKLGSYALKTNNINICMTQP